MQHTPQYYVDLADTAADREDYRTAAEMYEQAARASIGANRAAEYRDCAEYYRNLSLEAVG